MTSSSVIIRDIVQDTSSYIIVIYSIVLLYLYIIHYQGLIGLWVRKPQQIFTAVYEVSFGIFYSVLILYSVNYT